MLIRSVVVGRVDIEITGAPDAACKVRQDRRSAVAAPIPVPDVVYVCGTQHDGSAMIGDAIIPRSVRVPGAVSISVLRIIQSKMPLAVRGDVFLLGSANPDRSNTNRC